MKFTMLMRLLLATSFALAAQPALTEPVAGPGHVLRAIDGDNDLGEHFAFAERPGARTGFFYLADEGRLIASSCSGLTCSGTRPLSNPASDRGRHVSAATRTALTNRALLAYYDATSGDLIAFDCLSADCSFGIERTLETAGNVGQDTAIAIDPATGFALISYYDVSNGDLRLYRCASAICDSTAARRPSAIREAPCWSMAPATAAVTPASCLPAARCGSRTRTAPAGRSSARAARRPSALSPS